MGLDHEQLVWGLQFEWFRQWIEWKVTLLALKNMCGHNIYTCDCEWVLIYEFRARDDYDRDKAQYLWMINVPMNES